MPRKWGGSGSEKEEENLDFSASPGQTANGTSDLAADMSKVSLVDRDDDQDTDSELEGGVLLNKALSSVSLKFAARYLI